MFSCTSNISSVSKTTNGTTCIFVCKRLCRINSSFTLLMNIHFLNTIMEKQIEYDYYDFICQEPTYEVRLRSTHCYTHCILTLKIIIDADTIGYECCRCLVTFGNCLICVELINHHKDLKYILIICCILLFTILQQSNLKNSFI